MTITYKGKEKNVLTIKELYQMAKEQGAENAIIAVDFFNEDYENKDGDCVEYCEEVYANDITFCDNFRPFMEYQSDQYLALVIENHEEEQVK